MGQLTVESKVVRTGALVVLLLFWSPLARAQEPDPRPNILFCIADDWGWPHAGSYGETVVQTPSFDRLAAEGVLFEHAYVASPSCTPSRSAILTGQWHWRLEEAVNLWSTLRAEYPVYPALLAEAGYHVGSWRKAWGPGRFDAGGRSERPAGASYRSFDAFLEARPDDAPFCFWLGAHDPHRGYELGSGEASGMQLADIRLPACFPDTPEVRGDVADYYFEVQRFDRDVGLALARLEALGELENTLVVMTGDHGMPFPRCKGNLYDTGTRVCLAARWGAAVPGGRRLSDFVSLIDLAPTFLEAAGVAIPPEMSGASLLASLRGEADGRVDPERDHVLFGRERHTPAQAAPSTAGYPSRGLRTDRWLFVRNYAPELWPAGVPAGSSKGRAYADCDNGPTKSVIVAGRAEPATRVYYELAFAPRPAYELYDLEADPDQLVNLAADPDHYARLRELEARLHAALVESGDPRVLGGAERWDAYPYYGGMPR